MSMQYAFFNNVTPAVVEQKLQEYTTGDRTAENWSVQYMVYMGQVSYVPDPNDPNSMPLTEERYAILFSRTV